MRNLSATDLNPIISLNFIRHFFNSFFSQLFNLLKADRLCIVFRLLNRKSNLHVLGYRPPLGSFNFHRQAGAANQQIFRIRKIDLILTIQYNPRFFSNSDR